MCRLTFPIPLVVPSSFRTKFQQQTHDSGCPVARGTKWASNVWIWNRKRPRFTKSGAQIKQRKSNKGGILSWFTGTNEKPQEASDNGEVKIEFANDMKVPVKIFWKNGEDEKDFGTIQPGSTLPMNTFVKHVWLARKADGSNEKVGEYLANADQRTISIRG